MVVYAQTNDTGRVVLAMIGDDCPKECNVYEAPDEFTLDAMMNYVSKGNVLVYDPLPEVPAEPTMDERLAALEEENAYLKEALDLLLSGATEEAVTDA